MTKLVGLGVIVLNSDAYTYIFIVMWCLTHILAEICDIFKFLSLVCAERLLKVFGL